MVAHRAGSAPGALAALVVQIAMRMQAAQELAQEEGVAPGLLHAQLAELGGGLGRAVQGVGHQLTHTGGVQGLQLERVQGAGLGARQGQSLVQTARPLPVMRPEAGAQPAPCRLVLQVRRGRVQAHAGHQAPVGGAEGRGGGRAGGE